jgi:hypothetical protein
MVHSVNGVESGNGAVHRVSADLGPAKSPLGKVICPGCEWSEVRALATLPTDSKE